MIGPGGRSALVTFQVAGPHSQADTRVVRALDAVAAVQSRYPDLIVSETGGASVDRAATAMLGRDFHQAELTSVPLTLVLLLLVFGALIAASIPVILAGTAVTTTVSLLAIPSRWLPIGQGTSEVVLIIGMAVGIDYTLFYLRREREERAAGASFHDALRTAAATSGRAIVVSGLTVMISLAGLLFTGIDMFTGFAIGTMLVVGVAVVGSLTALPALLALLGPWADRARVPFLGKGRTRAERSRLWTAVVERVVRHPVAWGGLALIALAALAAPALGMRIGQPAINLPSSLPVVRTLDAHSARLPRRSCARAGGRGGIRRADLCHATRHHRHRRGGRRRRADSRARDGPAGRPRSRHGDLGTARRHGRQRQLEPCGDRGAAGRCAATSCQPRSARSRGVSYAVTGSTAGRMDYRSALRSASPLVFGIVAALAFVLLLMAFRSLAIPLVSIGLNLLSVGAAYGLITIIFQQGHLERLLGFTSFGGIIAWVPLFMFVFLFGLSMDYHVFVLSRIAELKSRGLATIDAVTGGISRGAGVVTSAAVIMVAVFSIFASLSTIDLKMIGVGLAFAVFIDATVVRGICVPAALALLGERSWYLPAWLRWLPKGISLDA